MESYDYVIVGAGSAGCCLANRLSESGASVLLLEAGPPDVSPSIHNPAWAISAIFSNPRVSQAYMTTPQENLYAREIDMARGIVRGGCSSINGMMYVRGNRLNYRDWALRTDESWSYENVLPYFIRSENYLDGPGSPYRGRGGLMDVQPVPDPSRVSYAFIRTCRDNGFPMSNPYFDYNGETQAEAATLYDVTVTRDGYRASNAVAFLDSIRNRQSLTVRTGQRASSLLLDRGRAVGVEVRDGHDTHVYHAEEEIILCGGSLESPKLLMLSGIGPADHLKQMGVEVHHDLPGVGANLEDHLMLPMYVIANPASRPGVSDYLAEAALFTSTSGSDDVPPDLQYLFSAGIPELGLNPYYQPSFIFNPIMLQPESRGTVRLRSADPVDHPVLDPNYLAEQADVDVLVSGVQLAMDLLNQDPLSTFWSGEPVFAIPNLMDPYSRMAVPKGLDELREFVRMNATTVWHPSCTCRMGNDSDGESVVDPELRVRGIENLRIADGSVLPRITSGNTNAPITMIAERAADLILGKSIEPRLAEAS